MDAPSAAWPGIYDLVSIVHGNPRQAVLTVTPRDSGYALVIEGPPGRLVSHRFARDSAHAVWLFNEGDTMFVALRVVGDSVHGTQRSSGESTAVEGARRR